jgi:CcmD family protein
MTMGRSSFGRVVHALAATLVVAWLTAGAPVTVLAQQPPPAARDEFVPASELPPEDQMPAAPLLIAAYAIAWLLIALYAWSLWRRLARVESDLATLRDRLARGAR